ncbi:hypothetical protein DAI22_05g024400 [Oryza sativa Japonica Group]|nr:hypothetical protein DAI22_05g024400 [Oryza sativa Japonica Group]
MIQEKMFVWKLSKYDILDDQNPISPISINNSGGGSIHPTNHEYTIAIYEDIHECFTRSFCELLLG